MRLAISGSQLRVHRALGRHQSCHWCLLILSRLIMTSKRCLVSNTCPYTGAVGNLEMFRARLHVSRKVFGQRVAVAGRITSARLISKDYHLDFYLRRHIFHNWCSFLILEPTLNPDTHTDTHCPLTMLNLACHRLFFEGHLTEIDVSWGKTADWSSTHQQHFLYVKRR